MGPTAASGIDMAVGLAVPGNVSSQPQPTEYTLQGVMRFLQIEWHRHERDRNAWEIERQEMRARIAGLEGQARRADATQKALRKYASILERKIKDQAAPAAEPARDDRAASIRERLHGQPPVLPLLPPSPPPSPSPLTWPAPAAAKQAGPVDDDAQRNELKCFLDQCQAEFSYLMVTPANPLPPRDSPPLPIMEDLRDVEALGMPSPQHVECQYQHQRPVPNHTSDGKVANARQHHQAPAAGPPVQPPPSAFSQPPSDFHSQPMVRSAGEHQPPVYSSSNDWAAPVAGTTRPLDQGLPGPNHAAPSLSGMEPAAEPRDRPSAAPEADAWDFPEGSLADHGASQQHALANRPDTDVFPNADYLPKSPGSRAPSGHRRKGSMSRRRMGEHELAANAGHRADGGHLKLRFGLRGHLDTVRTVIFSGGGSPGEPEICTAGDDGMIKRFHIPRLDSHAASVGNAASDLDVIANFTHRGHSGSVLSLTSWSPSPSFSTGGRAQGDGWIFSGGQDATIRVWERGRVDPKATLEGHTDAVWALCVLPTTLGAIFGSASPYGSADRILLASGAADGTVRLWSVSAPPQMSSPQPGTNRSMTGRGGRVRGNSMSSGSGFSSSPQPTTASSSPFHHTLVHVIPRADGSKASPTCIAPLGSLGESYVVSYSDAAVVVYDTRSGEQMGQMDSMETYDGSLKTSVNAVAATTTSGLDQGGQHHGNSMGGEDEAGGGGPTGGRSMAGSGVGGTIITGHEDRFVRFFDANSGESRACSREPPGRASSNARQGNARTTCWRTRTPSRACRSARTGASC